MNSSDVNRYLGARNDVYIVDSMSINEHQGLKEAALIYMHVYIYIYICFHISFTSIATIPQDDE